MIMDTLGALALATEPPNDELMKRPPVGRKGNFITNVMWRNITGQSIYQFVIIWLLQTRGKTAFHIDGPDSDLILNTLIFNSFVFFQVNLDKLLQCSADMIYDFIFRLGE
jgi:Ca2+-transporting ATPase